MKKLTMIFLALSLLAGQAMVAQTAKAPLTFEYHEGEAIAYKMHGINASHDGTVEYDAQAQGVVKKMATGELKEDFAWTRLDVNGKPFALSAASQEFRQDLSVAPSSQPSLPNLGKVQPMLIGPITDLLTFYVDVQLALRHTELTGPGTHTYIKYGAPASWADGSYVVLGQSSIDFDVTLQSIDPSSKVATLLVRHVPPAEQKITIPAAWMKQRVGDSENNWVGVQKEPNGKWTGSVGHETFEVLIKLALPAGRILSATMDNPVDVMERKCDDKELTVCGEPVRYQIRRQITLEAVKPEAAK
jgi:hypothetical protein